MIDRDVFNFQVDHMTLLVQPRMYNVVYLIFRTVFGCTPESILYEKRKQWEPGAGEKSMTFAMRVGKDRGEDPELNNTIIAVVQPTEPKSSRSHVREMLNNHQAAAHFQHVALRTPNLLKFHSHARALGVNFITPILRDETENVIQVFTGEWFFPDSPPSGLFFEFVQRNPTVELIQKLAEHNRESWFNDKTFLGLYGEKEKEYQSGKVKPFIDAELFLQLAVTVENKQVWEITDQDIRQAESLMRKYAQQMSN